MVWHFKSYEELTKDELYHIIRLRLEVFVVEQDAPYQDCDEKDFVSYHLWGEKEGEVVDYARLIPQGVSYGEPSIGRVVNAKKVRGTGVGEALMYLAVQAAETKFNTSKIRISAQSYLVPFYKKFGFSKTQKPEYLEDGIPHFEMLRD